MGKGVSKLPHGPWEVKFQGDDVQEYFIYSYAGHLMAQTHHKDLAYYIAAIPNMLLFMPEDELEAFLKYIQLEKEK